MRSKLGFCFSSEFSKDSFLEAKLVVAVFSKVWRLGGERKEMELHSQILFRPVGSLSSLCMAGQGVGGGGWH